MSLTTTIVAGIRAQLAGAADHGTPRVDLQNDYSKELASGTGSSQADLVFSDKRTLAASANETLDLNALTDAFGAAVNFAKVSAILIQAAAANTNDVVVGNGTNPFAGPLSVGTTTITLKPGGMMLLTAPVAGWTVTNSSNDGLKIANSAAGTSVEYDITIIGKSA